MTTPPSPAPEPRTKLWLWKNGDHYLAFDSLYPVQPNGDPAVLGEPSACAFLTVKAAPTLADAAKRAAHEIHETPYNIEAIVKGDNGEAVTTAIILRHFGHLSGHQQAAGVEGLRALAELECVNADPDSHVSRSPEQMIKDTNKELYFTKLERDYFKEELAKFKLIEANLQESCKRLEHTLEAYRKRARKIYTPEIAASKIAEGEARMRDVDSRLEETEAVLRYYGLEVVGAIGEGVSMLLTNEDGTGIRDCAYVRVVPGGRYAGDQSELKILREEFDKVQQITGASALSPREAIERAIRENSNRIGDIVSPPDELATDILTALAPHLSPAPDANDTAMLITDAKRLACLERLGETAFFPDWDDNGFWHAKINGVRVTGTTLRQFCDAAMRAEGEKKL